MSRACSVMSNYTKEQLCNATQKKMTRSEGYPSVRQGLKCYRCPSLTHITETKISERKIRRL